MLCGFKARLELSLGACQWKGRQRESGVIPALCFAVLSCTALTTAAQAGVFNVLADQVPHNAIADTGASRCGAVLCSAERV